MDYDVALNKKQELEAKTETIKPDKLEKHNKEIGSANTKWMVTTNDYDRSEAAVVNACRTAFHAKAVADLQICAALNKALVVLSGDTFDTLSPADTALAQAEAKKAGLQADLLVKCALLTDQSKFPKIDLATCAPADVAAANAALNAGKRCPPVRGARAWPGYRHCPLTVPACSRG
jgi:hypothetical protein